MSVGCYALSPAGGVRCDAYGPRSAPFVLVRVGGIMLRVRLCEVHERETNSGHRIGCTFNNYEKGDKCNCGGCDLPEEACVCIESDAWRASQYEAGGKA